MDIFRDEKKEQDILISCVKMFIYATFIRVSLRRSTLKRRTNCNPELLNSIPHNFLWASGTELENDGSAREGEAQRGVDKKR